jgi:hypothetical protein
LWGNGAKIELIVKGQKMMVNVFGMHLDYVNYGPDAANSGMKLQQILNNEQGDKICPFETLFIFA